MYSREGATNDASNDRDFNPFFDPERAFHALSLHHLPHLLFRCQSGLYPCPYPCGPFVSVLACVLSLSLSLALPLLTGNLSLLHADSRICLDGDD
ncbi:hypothetical protein LY76DRAFT_85661 [Colletotrichum caudatum]|nr:hypothetical protein LY76DRAFT_85661 [Colletotrichum caudatum]